MSWTFWDGVSFAQPFPKDNDRFESFPLEININKYE